MSATFCSARCCAISKCCRPDLFKIVEKIRIVKTGSEETAKAEITYVCDTSDVLATNKAPLESPKGGSLARATVSESSDFLSEDGCCALGRKSLEALDLLNSHPNWRQASYDKKIRRIKEQRQWQRQGFLRARDAKRILTKLLKSQRRHSSAHHENVGHPKFLNMPNTSHATQQENQPIFFC
eukprot:Gregarina_sp_Poly_1__10595@NODE_78_length_15809_cov_160_365646_g66_i0_p7_GENE_NODE_78_length_15809_cov_160_365646_g66_i0NODE_78_length_15809_cov_160_365646_g66_i0_p7_ORF_typecomplete_len182_score19_33Wbp11/PF09429_10/0_026_NODE_78_length_15809_cov_160_365646_g66_i052965841